LDSCFLLGLGWLAIMIPAALFAVSDNSTAEGVNVALRFLGTVVACFMLLLVGVNAAGRISRERERQTLDGLLTTPMETDDILFAKWLASVRSVRLFGWLFVWGWTIGVFSGGLHILAVPLLVSGWLVYAGCCATIGLFYSHVCRSTIRATVLTLLTILLWMGGPWVVGPWVVHSLLGYRGTVADEQITYQGIALSPPGGLVALTFYSGDFIPRPPFLWDITPERLADRLPHALIGLLHVLLGLLFYTLIFILLWLNLRRRFRMEAGRLPGERLKWRAGSVCDRSSPVADAPGSP